MIRIDPQTLEPTISLDSPAWYQVPLGAPEEDVREWASVIAREAAEEQGRPWAVEEAATTLREMALQATPDGVSARLVFMPDLTGLAMAYDILAIDPAGGPADMREAHRLVVGADAVGDGSLLDVIGLDDDRVVGLHVFDVRNSEPIEVSGGATIVPIASSRCVVRRLGTPLGDIDIVAIGACPDVELAALSLAPLHILLLGNQLFE